MSKRLFIVIGCILAVSLILTTSCKRDSVQDPDFSGNAAFEYYVTGFANPTTLWVPQGANDMSQIAVIARTGWGDPLPGAEILFQIFDTDYNFSDVGAFPENNKRSITKVTNNQGTVWVDFVAKSIWVTSSQKIYIKATLINSNRTQSYDYIPIFIETNKMPNANLAAYVTTTFTDSITGVAAAGADIDVYAYNNITTDPISFTIVSNDSWLTVSSPTGTTPNTFTITAAANAGTPTPRTGTVTLTAAFPSSIAGQTVTITVQQD